MGNQLPKLTSHFWIDVSNEGLHKDIRISSRKCSSFKDFEKFADDTLRELERCESLSKEVRRLRDIRDSLSKKYDSKNSIRKCPLSQNDLATPPRSKSFGIQGNRKLDKSSRANFAEATTARSSGKDRLRNSKYCGSEDCPEMCDAAEGYHWDYFGIDLDESKYPQNFNWVISGNGGDGKSPRMSGRCRCAESKNQFANESCQAQENSDYYNQEVTTHDITESKRNNSLDSTFRNFTIGSMHNKATMTDVDKKNFEKSLDYVQEGLEKEQFSLNHQCHGDVQQLDEYQNTNKTNAGYLSDDLFSSESPKDSGSENCLDAGEHKAMDDLHQKEN